MEVSEGEKRLTGSVSLYAAPGCTEAMRFRGVMSSKLLTQHAKQRNCCFVGRRIYIGQVNNVACYFDKLNVESKINTSSVLLQ